MNAAEIYAGSDAAATKALYAMLETRGAAGLVVTNLFRASKASSRAKVYRGGVRGRGSFKGMAYEKKEWSLKQLCQALADIDIANREFLQNESCSSPGCGYPDGKPCIGCGKIVDHGVLLWGWKEDPAQEFHRHVLYVELPTGQVSFHAAAPIRIGGEFPAFTGEWDGARLSAERIIAFTQAVIDRTRVERIEPPKAAAESPRDDRHLVQPGLFI